jgi:hypothetical protein
MQVTRNASRDPILNKKITLDWEKTVLLFCYIKAMRG